MCWLATIDLGFLSLCRLTRTEFVEQDHRRSLCNRHQHHLDSVADTRDIAVLESSQLCLRQWVVLFLTDYTGMISCGQTWVQILANGGTGEQ